MHKLPQAGHAQSLYRQSVPYGTVLEHKSTPNPVAPRKRHPWDARDWGIPPPPCFVRPLPCLPPSPAITLCTTSSVQQAQAHVGIGWPCIVHAASWHSYRPGWSRLLGRRAPPSCCRAAPTQRLHAARCTPCVGTTHPTAHTTHTVVKEISDAKASVLQMCMCYTTASRMRLAPIFTPKISSRAGHTRQATHWRNTTEPLQQIQHQQTQLGCCYASVYTRKRSSVAQEIHTNHASPNLSCVWPAGEGCAPLVSIKIKIPMA